MPLVGPSGSFAALASDEAYAACGAIFPEGWRNEVAARILFSLPLYRPVCRARSIGCPALLIACMRDDIVSMRAAITAAARMPRRTQLVALPIGHFDVYLEPWFEHTCAEQVAFFRRTLRP